MFKPAKAPGGGISTTANPAARKLTGGRRGLMAEATSDCSSRPRLRDDMPGRPSPGMRGFLWMDGLR